MNKENIPAASGSQYALVDGRVYRGDELVATVQGDGGVEYAPDMARYRAPVVRFLKSVAAGAAAPPEGPLEEPAALPSPAEGGAEAIEPVPVTIEPEAFGRAPEAITHTVGERSVAPQEPVAVGEHNSIPAAPPQDYRGDKTPAFVDWLWAYRPAQAVSRYENRGSLPGKSYEERRAALAARGE